MTNGPARLRIALLGLAWFCALAAGLYVLAPAVWLTLFPAGALLGALLSLTLSGRGQPELGMVPLGALGFSLFSFVLGGLLLSGAPEPVSLAAFFLLALTSGLPVPPLLTLASGSVPLAAAGAALAGGAGLLFAWLVARLLGHLPPGAILLLLGTLNALVAFQAYLLLPEFLVRFLLWVFARVLYRLRVSGAENVPREGAVILICNHVSFIDWLFISAAVRRPARFVMDHAYFKGFLLRTVLTQVKVIPIATARESRELMEAAFRRIEDGLREGAVVCLFPEGGITRDGKLHEFKPGVLQALQAVPVPVVPMALVGLWGSFFSRKGGAAMSAWPKRLRIPVELRIGPPLPPAGLRLEHMKRAVEELRGGDEP